MKLPEPVGEKKEKQEGPPDSVFASYKEWKEYQEDKKKGVKDADVMNQAVERNDNQPINGDVVLLQAAQGGGENAYLKLVAELDDLKQRAKQPQPPKPPQAGAGSDSNLVRFDKMYVNGFEALPYDAVIPQLRPNLDIPGKDKTIGSFPNLMDTMLMVEKLGRLDAYLGFLANVSVSNVTPEMSARYHQFYLKALARAYDLVTLALSQGADLTPEVLDGYKKAILGADAAKTQSELYKSLQDMDYYSYVKDTLLDPNLGRAWVTAPGGYLPLRWNADGGAQLVTWTTLKHDGADVAPVDFGNPNTNPLSLYRGAKAIQTPWYPIYIFNQGSASTLVFVQNFGAYQAIYGTSWSVKPVDLASDRVKPALKPKYPQYQALGAEDTYPNPFATSRSMREVVAGSANSFLGHLSWNYSVNFPQSGDDPARLRKFNALVLMPQPYNAIDPDPSDYIRGNLFSTAYRYLSDAMLAHYFDAGNYSAFRPRNNPSARRMVRRMDNGSVVDVAQDMPGGEAYVMLLPLNATTTGESLTQAFNYAPQRAPMNIITPTSLDLINKMAVLLE